MAGRVDDVHTIHHCLLSLKLFASSRFLSLNWPAGCHVCGCLMSHQLNWLAGSCWEAEQDSTGHPCRAVNGLSEWRSLLYWRKSACRRTLTDWLTVFWMTDSLTEPKHWPARCLQQKMLCMRVETQQYCCVLCPSSSSCSLWKDYTGTVSIVYSTWVLEHIWARWSLEKAGLTLGYRWYIWSGHQSITEWKLSTLTFTPTGNLGLYNQRKNTGDVELQYEIQNMKKCCGAAEITWPTNLVLEMWENIPNMANQNTNEYL